MRCLPLLLVVTACGASDRALATAPSAYLPVGVGAADLHLVDIDRDGHLDLVTRHLLQREIVVSLGDGAGGFRRAAVTRIADGPGRIDIADLNGDAALDLVIATRTDAEEHVQVLLGRSDGSFEPAPAIVTHAAQRTWKPTVILTDFDEDAVLDVITANGRRNTIELLRGDGRGGFAAPRSIALGKDAGRFYLASGDLDGDDHVDLVVAHVSEQVTDLAILHGDGAGEFATGLPVTRLQGEAVIHDLADVDGDGRSDLVLTHDHRLTILVNRGDGSFEPAFGSPIDVGRHAYDAVVADVDADGHQDVGIATVEDSRSQLVILRGDGVTLEPAMGSPFACDAGAYDLVAADVDHDGRADIFASSFDGDAVALVLGATF